MILYSRQRRMEGVGYGLGTSLPPRGVGKARGEYGKGWAWALQLLHSGVTLSRALLTFLIPTGPEATLKELEGKTVWQVTLVNSPDFSGFFFVMEALTQLLSQRQGV